MSQQFSSRIDNSPDLPDSSSVRACVSTAIELEQRIIVQRGLKTEVDLDEIPFENTTDSAQRVIHAFVHNLIEAAQPESVVSITLVNGICQWELEIAAQFDGIRSATVSESPTACPRLFNPQRDKACQQLRRLALECGGEIEQWDCPQGGAAFVLVVSKLNSASRAA